MISDQEAIGGTAAILIDHNQLSQQPLYLKLIQICEAFEYLEAFFVGRKHQARHNNLFTLAGEFSCFNRRYLLRTHLYDLDSIAEDTKLTFELRKKLANKKLLFLKKQKFMLNRYLP